MVLGERLKPSLKGPSTSALSTLGIVCPTIAELGPKGEDQL